MGTVDPADERRHQPDGTELWNESYYLDWFTPDGTTGGYLRVGFVPNLGGGEVWYWACLVEEGGRLVTVIDHDVAMPAGDQSLEIRHEGLWADHDVPEPVERMSASLESFAVALDDPADVYHGARGERVPFGFELDWHTDRSAYLWPPVTPRYEIPCRVEGRVLVGDREIEVDGWGQRDHSWGPGRDWWGMQWCWTAGRLDDGTRFHAVGGFVPGVDLGVGYVLAPGSTEFDELTEVAVEAEVGREGLVDRAHLRFGGWEVDVEPVAWSPVLLAHPDGRAARFPRGLARFHLADGRDGVGWIEFNQPPPAG
jgi:hypothetical protein